MFNKKFLSSTLIALAFSLGAHAGGNPLPSSQQSCQQNQEIIDEGSWSDEDVGQCDAGQAQQAPCQSQKGGASVGLAPNPAMPVNVANQDWSQQADQGCAQQDLSGQFSQISLKDNEAQRGFAEQNWQHIEKCDLTKDFQTKGITHINAVQVTIGSRVRTRDCGNAGFSNNRFENSTFKHASVSTPIVNLQWRSGKWKQTIINQTISHSTLRGHFGGTHFLGGMAHVDMEGAVFTKHGHSPLTIKQTVFAGHLSHTNFKGAHFDHTDFSQVTFGQGVSFEGATFGQKVLFTGAKFEVHVDGQSQILSMTEQAAAHFMNECHKVTDVAMFFANQGFILTKTAGGFILDIAGGAVDAVHTLGHAVVGAFVNLGGKIVHQANVVHGRFDSSSSSDEETVVNDNCSRRRW